MFYDIFNINLLFKKLNILILIAYYQIKLNI